MNYQQLKTVEDMVNLKGSKLWMKMNDDSKAAKQRTNFVHQYGGFFIQEGRYWKWKSPIEEKNGYWLKRVDTQEKVFFENMTEFSEKHDIGIVKICELLNGKRKTYKGWTAVDVRAVKETKGSFVKEKKKKAKKIPITISAVLVDITTGNILNIPSISEFAKQNNLDYANLRKVVIGKAKSYKNLKLYNPLDLA
jgi:predicted transcriptional regulator